MTWAGAVRRWGPPLVALLLLAAFGASAWGSPGNGDASFSGDARQTVAFGTIALGADIALQSDDRIVGVGSTYASDTGPGDFALTRLTTAGELDPSFSGDGKQVTDLGGDDEAVAVVIQPDGKLVVAGNTGANATPVIARYQPNGDLDPTFSGDGVQTFDLGPDDWLAALALDSAGRYVVAGQAASGFAVARMTAAGAMDTTFSGDGVVTTAFGQNAAATGVALQPDGKVVAGGTVLAGEEEADMAAARYTAGGQPDSSFSGDGKRTVDLSSESYEGTYDRANAVVVQPNGRIVLGGKAGTRTGVTRRLAVVGLRADGELDPAFGDGGVTSFFLSRNGGADGADLALQADGRILLGGSSGGFDTNYDFVVVRFYSNGELDRSFGGGGFVETNFGGPDGAQHDLAYGVAADSLGRVVLGGRSGVLTGRFSFAFARYEGGDEQPPFTSFVGQPATTTSDATPSFAFSSNEPDSTFECSFDHAPFSPCASPVTAPSLVDGPHRFVARAVDSAGNRDPGGAVHDFTVDTVAPETTVTYGPGDTIGDTRPSFAFVSNESPVTFECRIDAQPFAACESPHQSSPLADGPHTFEVRARDAAGNQDPSPARYAFVTKSSSGGGPSGGGDPPAFDPGPKPGGPILGAQPGKGTDPPARPSISGSASVGTVRVSATGSATLGGRRVACPSQGQACRVAVAASAPSAGRASGSRKAKRLQLGAASYVVKAGRTGAVKLRLNRKARRLLRRRKGIAARVTVTVRRGSVRATKTYRVTFRRS